MAYNYLELVAVERIENHALWSWYARKREEVRAQRLTEAPEPHEMATVPFPPLLGAHHLDHVPNECYLWHGTKPDVAPLIVHGGFDERVCALQGLFGAGVYFAMNSSKSDQYCTPDPSGTYTIFLPRVALGKAHSQRHHA